MVEIADLIPVTGEGLRVKVARVISVSQHNLTVDMGSAVQVLSADSCNPRPNDYVIVLIDGSRMTAIAATGGPFRQSTIIVTASTSTTVTGLINGVSTTISKSGAFTVSNGQVCPLYWPADGSRAWCLPNEQSATVDPGTGGSAGGGGGSVTEGSTTYAPTSQGTYHPTTGSWQTNAVLFNTGFSVGAYFYGTSRFRELQGRNIRYIRAFLPGSGSPTVWGHPHGSRPAGAPTQASNAGTRTLGGWVTLPNSLATYLISGSGTGGLSFYGGPGQAQGLPTGQIVIGWTR